MPIVFTTHRIIGSTTAWSKSYRRRLISGTSNSELRSGLARLTRGFFRVFSLPKVAFLLGMALVALNIRTVEQHWHASHVEVIEHHDVDEAGDALDDDVDAGRSGTEDATVDVEEVATPPPP